MTKNLKLFGKVVSSKMCKTVVVLVERTVKHPMYGKYVTKSTKYHVHDEDGICKEGDTVSIIETRPYSKTKKWKVSSIMNSIS